ncbi:Carboxy-terminal domain (CTD) phosphatase [Entomortierella lignicola]|nr:Carboxy-terminal domain (CTD) phosphatase [Entomortierella lignicola]
MSEDTIKFYIPAKFLPVTIVGIKTSSGATQSEGDELIEFEYTEEVEGFIDEGQKTSVARRSEIRASRDGIVRDIHVVKGEVIKDESKALLDFEGCDHDTQYEGLCVVCFKSVPKNSKSYVNMTHDATSLSVSRTEAKRLEKSNVDRLLDEGKLSLIVDLDQTLIHATVGTAIDEWVNAQGKMPEKVSAMYELHIYTMGTRNYAAAVANVIDPDGKLFSQRILSRDENIDMTQKSIERLFPCDTSMVVVIDDRADVWRYSPNLVKVHPYEYFVGTGDINAGHLPKLEKLPRLDPKPATKPSDSNTSSPNASTDAKTTTDKVATPATSDISATSDKDATSDTPATSNTPTTSDTSTKLDTSAKPDTAPSTELTATPLKLEDTNKASKPKAPVMDDNDDELKRVLKILEAIHEQYYDLAEILKDNANKKADVKAIISSMRSEVLKGVCIAFSGVIPKHQHPEKTDIWRQASSFGAYCVHEVDSGVTHVVAAQPGTEKVMKARRRKNIKIVRPEWLYHSIAKWKKQDETQYLLQKAPGKSTSNSTTPPMLTEGEDTGIEDEDDQGGISEGMDENHRPLSINNDEINEHLKGVDWDDMEKEVEELVGDMDESDFDSDTSVRSNTQSDVSTDGSQSPFVNLKRARIPRKSGLGATVTYGSSDDEDDNDSISNGVSMEGLEATKENVNFDDDGDIDEESGSDEDDSQAGSEIASDAERSTRPLKRRRVESKGKKVVRGGGDFPEDDIDADDEITMDHSTVYLGSQGDDSEDIEDEEDDDDFLNFMENDIGAQLQEDNDGEE